MDSSLSVYPLYTDRESKSVFCQLHNCLCTHICTEILCPKSGLICNGCLKLSIHKSHTFNIRTISEAVSYISQNLQGDNFDNHISKIRELQEIFSDTISFFKENEIPQLLSLEGSLVDLKENFWNSLLLTDTKNLRTKVNEIELKNGQEKISSLLSFLDSCSLPLSRIFTTDLRWYFDLAIQIIIDEFRGAILPYNYLVTELKKDILLPQKFQKKLLQNLTKVIIEHQSFYLIVMDSKKFNKTITWVNKQKVL